MKTQHYIVLRGKSSYVSIDDDFRMIHLDLAELPEEKLAEARRFVEEMGKGQDVVITISPED